MGALNYKHLHYFWVVAKTGSITRASERLHVTLQTISGQISRFEDMLGYKLFSRVGRRLELTDAGEVVLSYAEEIFTLGEELEDVLHHRPGERPPRFRVGVADALPKSVAYRLVEPALRLAEPPRIVCREGKLASLLADLAVHRLDIVLADSPMPANLNVRDYSHLLGECGLTFFDTAKLAGKCKGPFPRCLDGAMLLLPGEDAAVRPRLMRWFDKERIRPRIAGEFDDGALLKAFGEAGAGVFAAPSAIAQQGICPGKRIFRGSRELSHTEASILRRSDVLTRRLGDGEQSRREKALGPDSKALARERSVDGGVLSRAGARLLAAEALE